MHTLPHLKILVTVVIFGAVKGMRKSSFLDAGEFWNLFYLDQRTEKAVQGVRGLEINNGVPMPYVPR